MVEEYIERLESAETDEQMVNALADLIKWYGTCTDVEEAVKAESVLIELFKIMPASKQYAELMEVCERHAAMDKRMQSSYEYRTMKYASRLLQGERGDIAGSILDAIGGICSVMETCGVAELLNEDALYNAATHLMDYSVELRHGAGTPEPVLGKAAGQIMLLANRMRTITDGYYEAAYSYLQRGEYREAYELMQDGIFSKHGDSEYEKGMANAISYAAAAVGKLPGFSGEDLKKLRSRAMACEEKYEPFNEIMSETDAFIAERNESEAAPKKEPAPPKAEPERKEEAEEDTDDPLLRAEKLLDEEKKDEAYRLMTEFDPGSDELMTFVRDCLLIGAGAGRKEAKFGKLVNSLEKRADALLKGADGSKSFQIAKALSYAAMGVAGTRYDKWQRSWYGRVEAILEKLTENEKGMTDKRFWLAGVLLHKGKAAGKPDNASRKDIRKSLMLYADCANDGKITVREKDFMKKSGFVRFMNLILVSIVVFFIAFIAGHVPEAFNFGSGAVETASASGNEDLPEWVTLDVSTADIKYVTGYGKGATLADSWRLAVRDARQMLSEYTHSVVSTVTTEIQDDDGNVISTNTRLDYSDVVLVERDGVFAEAMADNERAVEICGSILDVVFSAMEYEMYVDEEGGVWVLMGIPYEWLYSVDTNGNTEVAK